MVRQLAVIKAGVGGVLLQQVHVAAGVEGFVEPGAGGETRLHLGDEGLLRTGVVFVAGEFHLEIEAARAGFVVGVGDGVELGGGEALELPVALGGGGEEGIAGGIVADELAGEGAVFFFGVGVVARVVEGVGVAAALVGGQRGEDAFGEKL